MIDAKQWNQLKTAAGEARKHAYAPYSSFCVGAAIGSDGRVFSGCNVENASYPVGMCAERSALGALVAAGSRRLDGVVVVGPGWIVPCGMCRQALAEFAPAVPLLLVNGDTGEETLTSLDAIFPSPFKGDVKP